MSLHIGIIAILRSDPVHLEHQGFPLWVADWETHPDHEPQPEKLDDAIDLLPSHL